MQVACLDTNIVIWGIKGKATQGQEGNIARAAHLFDTFRKDKVRLLIPAIVAAEAMVQVEPSERQHFLSQLSSWGVVAPFDAVAAVVFAEIWNANMHAEHVEQFKNEQRWRAILKADCMIAAIAIARRVSALYTTDAKLARIAARYIPVFGLPEVPPEQMNLPGIGS